MSIVLNVLPIVIRTSAPPTFVRRFNRSSAETLGLLSFARPRSTNEKLSIFQELDGRTLVFRSSLLCELRLGIFEVLHPIIHILLRLGYQFGQHLVFAKLYELKRV